MSVHLSETDLALYSTRDLPVARRAHVWLHVRACESCRAKVAAYQSDRRRLASNADQLPEGLDWESLAAEMTANVHLGLAAGECVAPRQRRPAGWVIAWRPAAVVAGLAVILTAAWLLNVPPSDTQALSRVFTGVMHGARRGAIMEAACPVVEATSAGVQLRENGGALQVSQSGLQPLTVSVSVQGSASARYIDTDTGQVTITSVYVQ